MANTAITAMVAITGANVDAAADVLPIVDTSVAGAAGNKKILVSQLFAVPTQTLVTPVLGVATATSINKVAITAPATSATLTLIDGTTVTGPAVTGTMAILGANTFTGAQAFGANNITGTGTANRFGTAGTNDTTADWMITASGSTKRALTLQASRAAGNADPLFAVTDFTAGALMLTVDAYGRLRSTGFGWDGTGQAATSQDGKLGFTGTNAGTSILVVSPAVWFSNSGTGASRMVTADNSSSAIGAMIQNSGGRQRVTTSDVTNATTTFGNITGIGFNSSAAGKYTGRLVVKCINSVAAEGIKFDFAGGTATASAFWAAAYQTVGGTVVAGTQISTALNGAMNFTTITGETLIEIVFSMVASGAGTVIPRFAEDTTATGTASVRVGSFMWTESTP